MSYGTFAGAVLGAGSAQSAYNSLAATGQHYEGDIKANRDPEIVRAVRNIQDALDRSMRATQSLRERLSVISRSEPSEIVNRVAKEPPNTALGQELRVIEDRIVADAMDKEEALRLLEI